jgi:hypothetical protein
VSFDGPFGRDGRARFSDEEAREIVAFLRALTDGY